MLGVFVLLVVSVNSVSVLDRAEFRVDPSPTIPLEGSWQSIPLKDWWTAERYEQGNHGWYRIHFELNELPTERLGILIRRVNMNAEVHLNGELVLSGGRFEEPVARNWNHPLYTTPVQSLFRVGTNTLHVRHASYAVSGSLPEIYIGPASVLSTEAETLALMQSGIADFCFL
ncbi:MAG: hypothetical protein GKR90_01325 [Pseudomonadales bacterium]|nr:hypothetical protein [Pseudomonadales bacterium]